MSDNLFDEFFDSIRKEKEAKDSQPRNRSGSEVRRSIVKKRKRKAKHRRPLHRKNKKAKR